eukprot:CAMPEP_0183788944 /NCGR_PEP_ID=MMETSP0803_2-20130417/93_1 /TAXON_ID=195967 /ORGANISM="Crustomastix stigmata, Strain CCMP3273" /LENGTH=216 /DNA_ID=CAMNT_0026033095 /DNA_START=117 /DNA_END=767 /DNA_ORIENTATION=-
MAAAARMGASAFGTRRPARATRGARAAPAAPALAGRMGEASGVRRESMLAGLTGPRVSGTGHRRVATAAAKVSGYIKLAIEAGKANPSPPIGPALGAKGVNIMQFCKEYNARTADKAGFVIPVEITVFEDRSFTFVLKTPPASVLLKKAAKIGKGSANPKKEFVGTVTMEQVKEIAETKLPDLNCTTVSSAMESVMGTANNMGIKVEGDKEAVLAA